MLLPPVATTFSTPLAEAIKLSNSPSTITKSLLPVIPDILINHEFLYNPVELKYLGVWSFTVLNLKPFISPPLL